MTLTKNEAVAAARKDLAKRIDIDASEIDQVVEEADFPDMALGASEKGELSGQMITPGWRISLTVNGHKYEYRANKNQLRLLKFKGKNLRIA
jgi:hypothetical protein